MSNAARERDPFSDDVLERLIKSEPEYQRTHGHYIVPLAERLLDTRAALRSIRTLAVVADQGDPWYAEHEGVDAAAIYAQARAALGEAETDA